VTDAPDILLPRPHRNQAAVLDSTARWKLINCGGRFGKTRLALIGGTLGHGPRQADGTPLRRGVAQGGMVAWVAPDYPQSRAIWQEEILPRFGGKAHLGVEIRETERQVRFPGGGFWEIRSARLAAPDPPVLPPPDLTDGRGRLLPQRISFDSLLPRADL